MENTEKKCECGMHPMGPMGYHGCHGGKHHLIKIILKIIIVILIFWCGFKLGNITGSIRGEYGHGNRGGVQMMRGYNNFNNIIPPNANTGTQTTPTPVK